MQKDWIEGDFVSVQVLQSNLWPTITKLAHRAKRKHIAVAYLGRGASKLLPLSKGDCLVVDMSQAAVKSGQTNPSEVEKYLKKEVAVYSCSNLHAKVSVLGQIAIIGSSNVSQRSRNTLIEVGLLCADKDVVANARGLVKSLAAEPVTPEYIKFCKRIYKPPKIKYAASVKGKMPITPLHSPLWIMPVRPIEYSDQESELADRGSKKAAAKIKDAKKYVIRSVRFLDNSRFIREVRAGDWAVQIWSYGGYTEIIQPSRIVQITRTSKPINRYLTTFIFIEELKKTETVRWVEFKRIVKKAGLKVIKRRSLREIKSPEVVHAIFGLWK